MGLFNGLTKLLLSFLWNLILLDLIQIGSGDFIERSLNFVAHTILGTMIFLGGALFEF